LISLINYICQPLLKEEHVMLLNDIMMILYTGEVSVTDKKTGGQVIRDLKLLVPGMANGDSLSSIIK
jgi:hypothetical protein